MLPVVVTVMTVNLKYPDEPMEAMLAHATHTTQALFT